MSVLPLLTVFYVFGTAAADEPAVGSDGTVSMRVILPASEAEVREQLNSAEKATALVGAATIISRESAGPCERLTYQTPGMMSPLTYVALRCPTEAGWKETLESSEHFQDNESEWQLREVDGGTELRYRVRVRLSNMPVGQGLVNSRVAQSMKHAIERLEERLSQMF
ncbi:MAG: hypothetical protein AAFV53_05170 [Myxococcota bacterium]